MYRPHRRQLDRVQSRSGQQLPRHHFSRRQSAQHQRQPSQRSAQVAVEQEGHPHRPDLRSPRKIARRDVPQLRRQCLDAQAAHARQDGGHDQPLRAMTDETRILRTVGIPIVIAIVLLVVVPKSCAKMVTVAKARQEKARESGLHIESTHKPAEYPGGLDADRIRYLVEIDSRFAAPYTLHLDKSATTVEDAAIAAALQKLGYLEQAPDGTRTLTRDGLLHLDGLAEDANSWTFPVATRHFESVSAIEGDHAAAHVTVI